MELQGWEHFEHRADIGIRGFGESPAEAFEQCALAMMAIITDLSLIEAGDVIKISCEEPDPELLLVDWLNAVIYEMVTRKMLFCQFEVTINDGLLKGRIRGEPIDVERHHPAVEIKGATRAFGPDHPSLPAALRSAGQPVLIGGTMGTASYILAGTQKGMEIAYGSACHGAGRSMSRRKASKLWQGNRVIGDLAARNILIRSPSQRGVAEEALGAYKDINTVVESSHHAGLASLVAKLEPMICIKG